MRSFLMGTIIEPEIREVDTKKGRRSILSLAILSGRTSIPFDVWDDDRNFKKFVECKGGEQVCAIVSDGVDGRGRIKYYLNDLAPCSQDLREDFRALFK